MISYLFKQLTSILLHLKDEKAEERSRFGFRNRREESGRHDPLGNEQDTPRGPQFSTGRGDIGLSVSTVWPLTLLCCSLCYAGREGEELRKGEGETEKELIRDGNQ